MSEAASIKNILMITPWVPDENGSGAHKRAAAHLKALTRNYRVHLLIFTNRSEIPASHLEWLGSLCVSVVIIPVPEAVRPAGIPPKAIIRELLQSQLYRELPGGIWLPRALNDLGATSFDAVFFFRISSALLLNRMLRLTSISTRRKIVDFDDIESISKKRSEKFVKAGTELAIVNKIIYMRLKKIENDLLRTYQDVLVCSDLDKKLLQSRSAQAVIHAIPNSVPLAPIVPPDPERPILHILFVGSGHAPNRDGILWFCGDILPLIRKQSQLRCRLSIVGVDPGAEVLALAKLDDVIVTGGVESVAPYYNDCDLVIAPIRFGAGTRIKILEAMSYQKPVVTTVIGAEGIEIEDGRNILLADSPQDFARACIALLENRGLRLRIGEEGRKCVEEKYSAQVVADRLNQILHA